jgi:dihydrofolate synthase/folylpolyglutamate synthase
MTFQQAYNYLLERLPMFQRLGKAAYKEDIGNIVALCDALDKPHLKFRSIHVGGTNGKGSVSSMLAAILTSAGYKTGLYTSPHLKSFTERIRIDGQEIPEEVVAGFVEKNQPLFEEVSPSYFEVTVAMAFDFFAQEEVDIAIIEVGLGGRLDSTNIIHPELSIITNIGWDHMDILGDSLEKIAGEKAGIIKAKTPVVIGETQEEIKPVFTQKAALQESPLFFADKKTSPLVKTGSDWSKQDFEWEALHISLDLAGGYQQKNLRTALCAIQQMRKDDWKIPDSAIVEGLANVQQLAGLKGRMQLIQEHPPILADTAHNKEGLIEALHQLTSNHEGPLGIVLGMVSDKDHDTILTLFPKEANYFFVKPAIPRGMDASELASKAHKYGLEGKVYDSVGEGLAALKQWLPEEGMGFVGGSTFTVAEVV